METRHSTSLVWYHRKNKKKPAVGNRILIMSPMYGLKDSSRTRIIDSEFYHICADAEWWAYINEPKIESNEKEI